MAFRPWTLAACAALWLLATGGPAAACSSSDDCWEDECGWRPDFLVLASPPEPADLELVSTDVEGEVWDDCEGDSRPYQEAVVRLTSGQPVVLVRDPERDGDGYADITAINLVPTAGSVELSLGSSGSDPFLSGAADFRWAGAEPGVRSQLQAASFDEAGRFSGWGEPVVVLMPIRGWSCGFAPGGGGVLALLLLPLLRRRRSKPG